VLASQSNAHRVGGPKLTAESGDAATVCLLAGTASYFLKIRHAAKDRGRSTRTLAPSKKGPPIFGGKRVPLELGKIPKSGADRVLAKNRGVVAGCDLLVQTTSINSTIEASGRSRSHTQQTAGNIPPACEGTSLRF
jgi:hypothetical protein